MTLQTVILAAGMGSRLGRSLPKPLTELSDGRSIMQQQHDNIRAAFGTDATHHDGRRLQAPRRSSRRSPTSTTSTTTATTRPTPRRACCAPSPRRGKGGVLWMNGDVVFDPLVLGRAIELIERDQSFVTVNTSKVSDEEVKYTVTAEGYIKPALQDRRGRHRRGRRHQLHLQRRQEGVHPPARRASTTRTTSSAVSSSRSTRTACVLAPLDISDLYAVEVDFAEDLERANLFV